MSESEADQFCYRCGCKLKHTEEGIPLPCLSRATGKWRKLDPKLQTTNSLIEILAAESGVSIAAVTEYVHHAMGHGCVEKIRNCPVCGKKLRNWRAKMCIECGADFEPLSLF